MTGAKREQEDKKRQEERKREMRADEIMRREGRGARREKANEEPESVDEKAIEIER